MSVKCLLVTEQILKCKSRSHDWVPFPKSVKIDAKIRIVDTFNGGPTPHPRVLIVFLNSVLRLQRREKRLHSSEGMLKDMMRGFKHIPKKLSLKKKKVMNLNTE